MKQAKKKPGRSLSTTPTWLPTWCVLGFAALFLSPPSHSAPYRGRRGGKCICNKRSTHNRCTKKRCGANRINLFWVRFQGKERRGVWGAEYGTLKVRRCRVERRTWWDRDRKEPSDFFPLFSEVLSCERTTFFQFSCHLYSQKALRKTLGNYRAE